MKIGRRGALLSLAGAGAVTATAILVPPYRLRVVGQVLVSPNPVPPAQGARAFGAEPDPWAATLIAAAESQIGTTVSYDPAYVRLAYPGGDVARERGVCTDVVIRAYRDAFGLDLQKLVHEDMTRAFKAYPQSWGLARPDANIDHRRVPNLATFLTRRGASVPVTGVATDYLPGDVVTQLLPGRLTHIGIVTHRPSPDGARPMMVHNIGAGARLEDVLFGFEITGHFRFPPPGV